MRPRALILIEGARTGNGLLYVQAAQRLGLHPITLSADPAQYDYLAEDGTGAIRVDTGDLGALIRECSRLLMTFEIAGIIGFAGLDESVNVTVGRLCRHFGLPGPSPASIEHCYDKFAQRRLLAQAGVSIPAYRVAANAREVVSAAAEIGLPVVLKPIVGSGSSGVRLCRDVDEVAEHTSYLLGGTHVWQCSPRILVEEYAQGPYCIANTMGNEVIGVAAGEFGPPPYFVFRETIFPAPLTDNEYKRIVQDSLSCLQALSLDWGPANIEFRRTKRGPVVIEVNPRISGAPDPQLIQLACGVDLITEHVKLAIGEELDLRKSHSQTAAARNLVPDCDGTLDWIEGASRAAAVPGIIEVKLYVEPKSPIVLKGDYRDWIGHIIAASPSAAQTAAILDRAVGLLDWSITPFPIPVS
ncbi:ATP-grasp domain-containing protein (plasmid) [Rhizobium leguminosarum]|jgi:biotin carboxylase